MRTVLIAYSSKTGTVETCVRMLEAELKGLQVTLADLDKETPDISAFDIIVFGSSIRFGKLRPSAARFLKVYADRMAEKPHGLFLCCGYGHEFEEYSKRLFPQELRASAFAVLSFGGKLKLERASIPEKLFLHHVRSAILESEIDDGEFTPTLPGILPENISMMASALRRTLADCAGAQSQRSISKSTE